MALTSADIWAVDLFVGITIKEWNTFFTMLTLSIVLTIVTYTTADPARVLIDGLIKVTRIGVIVTIACYRNRIECISVDKLDFDYEVP